MSTEIEFESDLTRNEIAERLEQLASSLRGDGPVELDMGGRSVTLNPPDTLEFEIEVEDEGEHIGGDVERSVEIELEWMKQADEGELPAE